MMLFGGSWLVLAGLANGRAAALGVASGGLLAMLYLAVFGSALAYTATRGCSSACRSRVATFRLREPASPPCWLGVLGTCPGESLARCSRRDGRRAVGVALVTLPGRLAWQKG